MDQSHWGERLQFIIKHRNYNKQIALASELGVDKSTVCRWIQGENIKLSYVIQICEILDISADWLLMGRGSHSPYNRHEQSEVLFDHLPSEINERILEVFLHLESKN